MNSDTLRIGFIGCGGRGTGAAGQALNADKNVELTAMGDVFADKIQSSLATLYKEGAEKGFADRIKVPAEKRFVGLDAYQKVIDSGVDVVLLTTPPCFRPTHLQAAVDADKHVFAEKPMATDAPGVRSVIKSVKVAKEKKLSIVAGFCWRYESPRREFYKRIHAGAIGEILAIHATFYWGGLVRPTGERPADMGDLEWQLRNWYKYRWLSGDGFVEQACHSVDKIAWALKESSPVKAVAVGGRQTPVYGGNIFDHMFVVYDFGNDLRAFVAQRQVNNCFTDNSDYLFGSEGIGIIPGWNDPFIRGKQNWRYRGPKINMYQVEHDEFFAGIRSGNLINDGERMAHSTMMAIMGRMAAYTGQEVTWEDASKSQERFVPEKLDWNMKLPVPPIAVPGFTKLV
jgi:predicted dehydrogenase